MNLPVLYDPLVNLPVLYDPLANFCNYNLPAAGAGAALGAAIMAAGAAFPHVHPYDDVSTVADAETVFVSADGTEYYSADDESLAYFTAAGIGSMPSLLPPPSRVSGGGYYTPSVGSCASSVGMGTCGLGGGSMGGGGGGACGMGGGGGGAYGMGGGCAKPQPHVHYGFRYGHGSPCPSRCLPKCNLEVSQPCGKGCIPLDKVCRKGHPTY